MHAKTRSISFWQRAGNSTCMGATVEESPLAWPPSTTSVTRFSCDALSNSDAEPIPSPGRTFSTASCSLSGTFVQAAAARANTAGDQSPLVNCNCLCTAQSAAPDSSTLGEASDAADCAPLRCKQRAERYPTALQYPTANRAATERAREFH